MYANARPYARRAGLFLNPDAQNYLKQLTDAGVRWALYGGVGTAILTNSRKPVDIDVIVPREDVAKIVQNSPATAERWSDTPERVLCGDGVELDFPRTGIRFELGGQEVEVVASGDATYKGHTYHLACTELSLSNRIRFWLDALEVWVANPFDIVGFKAVMQRGESQSKCDVADIRVLHQEQLIDRAYAKIRSAEINLNARATRLLGYGIITPDAKDNSLLQVRTNHRSGGC